MSRALVALVLLLAPPAALADGPPTEAPADADPSPEVREFLRAWEARMEGVRTLRVEFVQEKRLRILRRPLVSQGTTLMRDGRVLMVVRGADGQVETELLVSQGEARLHYPRLARVEVYPVEDGAAPPSPFPLFGADLEALPRTYRLRLERDGEADVLVLVPRAAGSPIAETRMRFRDHEVVGVEQRGVKGDVVALEVTRFERNPDLREARLELSAGPDAAVVYPFGEPRGSSR